MLKEKLKYLKDKSGMTLAQISEKSGVPLPTVNRIFSGKTYDPGIRTILSIVNTMGGSIEDLQGISEKNMNTDKPTGAGDGADMIIEELSKIIRSKEKWINILAFTLIGVFIIFLAIVAFDILNPTVGWFRK